MSVVSPKSVVAVFERRAYWGPELQRQFQHASVAVKECRVLGDLLPSIIGFDSALIVIDLDSGLADCLAWLGQDVSANRQRHAIVACGSARTNELEWLLREAGVTAYLPDVICGDDFGRLCRRQLGLKR